MLWLSLTASLLLLKRTTIVRTTNLHIHHRLVLVSHTKRRCVRERDAYVPAKPEARHSLLRVAIRERKRSLYWSINLSLKVYCNRTQLKLVCRKRQALDKFVVIEYQQFNPTKNHADHQGKTQEASRLALDRGPCVISISCTMALKKTN